MMGYYGGWAAMGWFGVVGMLAVLLALTLLVVVALRAVSR